MGMLTQNMGNGIKAIDLIIITFITTDFHNFKNEKRELLHSPFSN